MSPAVCKSQCPICALGASSDDMDHDDSGDDGCDCHCTVMPTMAMFVC